MNVIYEDKSIVVCEKPIGVLSQKDTGGAGEDMLSLLAHHFEENSERATAYVLHRLDLAVGGLMVYAKDKRSAAALSGAIARGEMMKSYYAICHGDVRQTLGESGEFFDLLFRDSGKNKSFVTNRMRKGVKEARLTYRVMDVCESETGALSLLSVTLGTGRTHQIRVQFSSRGHALFGDARYGSRARGQDVALFSASLGFLHPKTGQDMTFSLPLPQGEPWDRFQKEESQA